MKTKVLWWGLAALFFCGLTLCAGCATPLRQQYATQLGVYNASLQAAIALRKQGAIDDATAVRIEAVRVVAAEYLRLLKLAADTENDEGFAEVLAQYAVVAGKFHALILKGP